MTTDEAPGVLVLTIPCGPAYQANLLATINWLAPNLTGPTGPAQQVLARLLEAASEARYERHA